MAPDRLLKLLKNLPDPRRYAARQELAFRFTILPQDWKSKTAVWAALVAELSRLSTPSVP